MRENFVAISRDAATTRALAELNLMNLHISTGVMRGIRRLGVGITPAPSLLFNY
jgi:hypothetical protein